MTNPSSFEKLTPGHYKLLALAGAGGALEFLDFTIYALFARYLSHNFFPETETLSALLNTFGIFAVGYFARPLGGIVFGYLGDRFGRKNAFTISAFVMAFATLLMGCLPAYATIGIAAPLLLLLCRILQGISVGGEVPGATVFVVEHYPVHRRGLAVGIIAGCVTLGNVMGGSLGYFLSSHLSEQAMLEWGWRVPFILGSILALVAYFLRKKALETPVFLQLMQEHATQKFPLAIVAKTALPQLLVGIGLTALSAVTIFLFLYLPSYPLVQARYDAAGLYFINTLAFLVLVLVSVGFGILSDYIKRKRLILIGAASAVIVGYFLFRLLFAQNVDDLLVFCLGVAVLVGSINGCYGCALAELFPPKIRYTGMGVSYNIGFALFGGLSTFVMTILVQLTHAPLALYVMFAFCGLITFFAATGIKEELAVR